MAAKIIEKVGDIYYHCPVYWGFGPWHKYWDEECEKEDIERISSSMYTEYVKVIKVRVNNIWHMSNKELISRGMEPASRTVFAHMLVPGTTYNKSKSCMSGAKPKINWIKGYDKRLYSDNWVVGATAANGRSKTKAGAIRLAISMCKKRKLHTKGERQQRVKVIAHLTKLLAKHT